MSHPSCPLSLAPGNLLALQVNSDRFLRTVIEQVPGNCSQAHGVPTHDHRTQDCLKGMKVCSDNKLT